MKHKFFSNGMQKKWVVICLFFGLSGLIFLQIPGSALFACGFCQYAFILHGKSVRDVLRQEANGLSKERDARALPSKMALFFATILIAFGIADQFKR